MVSGINYRQIDTNCDGRISAEEFAQNLVPALMNALRECDLNKDGTIADGTEWKYKRGWPPYYKARTGPDEKAYMKTMGLPECLAGPILLSSQTDPGKAKNYINDIWTGMGGTIDTTATSSGGEPISLYVRSGSVPMSAFYARFKNIVGFRAEDAEYAKKHGMFLEASHGSDLISQGELITLLFAYQREENYDHFDDRDYDYGASDIMSARVQEAFYKDTGLCLAGPQKPGEKFRAKEGMKFGDVWDMTFYKDDGKTQKTTWEFKELFKNLNKKCSASPRD